MTAPVGRIASYAIPAVIAAGVGVAAGLALKDHANGPAFILGMDEGNSKLGIGFGTVMAPFLGGVIGLTAAGASFLLGASGHTAGRIGTTAGAFMGASLVATGIALLAQPPAPASAG